MQTTQIERPMIEKRVANAKQFVGMVAKHSVCAEIGSDLLNLFPEDSSSVVCHKMETAIRNHPDHLTEIVMTGMAAIIFTSESKDEILKSFLLTFGVADRVMSH
jgi:hypothetical protein